MAKKMTGKTSEYGGMEKYPSKKAMVAHEKKESKGMEASEGGRVENNNIPKELTEEEVVVPAVEAPVVEAPIVEEVINPYTIGHATRAFRG